MIHLGHHFHQMVFRYDKTQACHHSILLQPDRLFHLQHSAIIHKQNDYFLNNVPQGEPHISEALWSMLSIHLYLLYKSFDN